MQHTSAPLSSVPVAAGTRKKAPALTVSDLPKTWEERLKMPEVLEVKATLDEYFQFLESCEYRVEYSDGKIIAMGYASLTHEAMVIRIGYLLTRIFGIDGPYQVLGSNAATFIEGFQAIHNADVVVLKGKPEYYIHNTGKKRIKTLTNPWMVVEILSKTTRRHDLGVKLPRYKTLSSVQHIFLIDQKRQAVSLYSRTGQPGQWLNHEITDVENGYMVFNRKRLKMSDIYRNVLTED
jgi:Uma2 family endonuclease